MSASSMPSDAHYAKLRILSYNFNILPRGSGGYQTERIESFLQSVSNYDVIVLQEVYATSLFPYWMQRRTCPQKQLLDGLREHGFEHYVISRQPSYASMWRYGLMTDCGLVIASRFPIHQRGSYTFRNYENSVHGAPNGCLFAEIEVPPIDNTNASERLVVFNVHLRPDDAAGGVGAKQTQEIQMFIRNVLRQFRITSSVSPASSAHTSMSDDSFPSADSQLQVGCVTPFVVAGDFGYDGSIASGEQHPKTLNGFIGAFEEICDVRDVIFEKLKVHPPTRPPKLFFPTQTKLVSSLSVPVRQDYLLLSAKETGADLETAKVEKFVASSRRPYTYLSDHFGISAVIKLSDTVGYKRRRQGPNQGIGSPLFATGTAATAAADETKMPLLAEDPVHERSHPTAHYYTEATILAVIAYVCFTISWKYAIVWGSILGVLWWFATRIDEVQNYNPYSAVPDVVVTGEEAMPILPIPSRLTQNEFSKSAGDGRHGTAHLPSIAELWSRAVFRCRYKVCLGQSDDPSEPEWLTFGAVDRNVREIGAGLIALGANAGEIIGVDAPANRRCIMLELACAMYGFATVTLTGSASVKRSLIDKYNVRIVVSGNDACSALLLCRSRSLEKLVHLAPTPTENDEMVAKDVNIQLIPFENVEFQGRIAPCSPPAQGEVVQSPFLLAPWTGAKGSGLPGVEELTQADVVSMLQTLAAMKVLPAVAELDSMVLFAPFMSVFNRVYSLGLVLLGGSVVASSGERLQEAFMYFKPTILVASPNIFLPSALQLKRTAERYGSFHRRLFEAVYQFRSALIHVHQRDSSLLRFLFFRSYQRHLGGNIRKIVIPVSEESTSYLLEEHIAVCYTPCVQEVCFQLPAGIVCVNGIPAPGLRVRLNPVDDLARSANVGQLVCSRGDGSQEHTLEVMARWNKDSTLTLFGSPSGFLWPVDYHFAVAAEIERVLSNSRFVTDIFVWCEPQKPIVAIVYPTKDTVEYEWFQTRGSVSSGMRPVTWTDLVEVGTQLLMDDFQRIGKENHMHPSHIPQFVHLHPHAFRDHIDFLTPYGRLRRQSLESYFKDVVERVYNCTMSPVKSPMHQLTFPPTSPELGSSQLSSPSNSGSNDSFFMKVPVVVDIGGTFAKIAYILPPGDFIAPSFMMHEASSLVDCLGGRTFEFFGDENAAMVKAMGAPASQIGKVCFARILSKNVPDFIEFLRQTNATSLYKRKWISHVRATGGGAFKYAATVKSALGVSLTVVKEMDAVVGGLNLLLRIAQDSVFTVDPQTGERLPHRLAMTPGAPAATYPLLLINIGSGISFIKVLGPDNSYVRVGGSPIGGATFWGLVRTMTNLTSWEEVMEVMRLDGPGDNTNVDLLVGDIYGYNAKELPAMLSVDTTASTFGKLGTERFYEYKRNGNYTNGSDDALNGLSPLNSPGEFPKASSSRKPASIDIVRSLLMMLANNVTQLAYLHSRVEGIQNIFFAGGFVRDNPLMWRQITTSLQYWTKGERHAHFLMHDGYLGALGSAQVPLSAEDLPSSSDTESLRTPPKSD